jgi:hypothetical protein
MSITYISGGLLGDFFHQLSIINEIYIKTNKKGILYIANIGDKFRDSLEKTYDDLHEIIFLQEYIEDFKIYNNEKYDINLSDWRNYFSSNTRICNIFKNIYDIEWGRHKWINNIPIFKEWENKKIINTTHYRFPNEIFLKQLKSLDLTNFVYVSIFKYEYEYFVNKTNIQIPYYSPKSLMELCIILNSCEKFMGSLSAPLSIATSLHKNCVYGTDGCNDFFNDIDINISTVKYNLN